MKPELSWKCYVAAAGLSLLLAAIACNAPTADNNITPTASTAEVTQTPSQPGAPTATTPAVTTEAPPAASSPTPILTQTTPCNYDSVYVADVTIPDGTQVVSGASFTKTWRIQNNGCLPWPNGTVLLFVEGNQMGGPASVAVPATAVGGTQDISVPLVAPNTPGEQQGYWRLRSADGIQFGDKIYVKINSVPPTPTPTVVLPPPVQAFPDLYVSEFSLSPATPVQGSPVHVRVGVYNKGTAKADASFVVRWYGGENFANVSCEWTIDGMVKSGGRIVECDFTFSSWYPSINTKVVVDATNTVTESDEANNIFLKAISVAKP